MYNKILHYLSRYCKYDLWIELKRQIEFAVEANVRGFFPLSVCHNKSNHYQRGGPGLPSAAGPHYHCERKILIGKPRVVRRVKSLRFNCSERAELDRTGGGVPTGWLIHQGLVRCACKLLIRGRIFERMNYLLLFFYQFLFVVAAMFQLQALGELIFQVLFQN